jgi:tetratricopeptide (TPR) repeat protein
MYNANRLARSAKKAEREGRTFEANNLWGQVATKAESVLVRHPTSKYADQAGVLRGVALAKLGQCEQALTPLSRANAATPSDLTEDALLAGGRCQLALGNFAEAQAAFSQLLDSKDHERRLEAHFQQGRLLRQAGRNEEALQALEGIRDPRADGERILALAGAGRVPQALSLADSLLARGDTTKPWDSLIVSMGRKDPAAAADLVDRMGRLPRGSPELQAQRLLEDGIRLSAVDQRRAAARFHSVIAMSKLSENAGRARLQLILLKLRHITTPAGLAAIRDSLSGLSNDYEAVGYEAAQLAAAVSGVYSAATAVTWESAQGDIRLFLAAETARDSLKSPVLAERLFRRILNDFPNSSYGAKVVLAVQQLNPAWRDSAQALLDGLYVGSPYLAMIRGEDPPEYRQLEDSLGTYAATQAPKKAATPRRRVPADRDADTDLPGARPPAPGTSRVPEP